MTATGLSVSDVVNVTTTISPLAAPYENFGALLLLGSSAVIDVNQRSRQYASLTGVAQDFGTTAAEYLAADLFFSQSPQPAILYIGRWAQTATPGLLHGATLSAAQQALTNFTAVTSGSFAISIDGTAHNITGLNFSGALNLNGVASLIQAALPSGVDCTWNSTYSYFTIVSGTTGTSSAIGYATTEGAGTDVSGLLGLSAIAGAAPPVVGIAAETLLTCVSNLTNTSQAWYGLTVATSTPPQTSDYLAVAAFIEGAGLRIFGITTQDPTTLVSSVSSDLASQLMALGYSRTCVQYSSSSPYAVCSLIGRAFTVDFTANDTTITLKFKQEPGVTAEYLTETQAATLNAKNCNVFVNFINGTAIIQQGVMCNGYFFDERQGLDWLQNRIQVDVYNLLYQSTTKIPQTDAGVGLIVATIKGSCLAAVNNGLVAPGVWNASGFGSLNQGDTLSAGFYVFAPLVSSQSQAIREQRIAPTIQVAVKLAGAVHFVDVIVNVNR